jgi:hypothetical protein
VLLQDVPGIAQETIADTVAAVFSEAEFNPRRGLFGLPSLWWWTKYLDFSLDKRVAWWLGTGIVVILLLAAVGIAVRRHLHAQGRGAASGDLTRGGVRGQDAWTAAQELAAAGDFTGAAHALYVALLGSLAKRDLLRLHPSKTIGDYLRELRRRPSAPAQTMVEFARTYELVAYGLRPCDADRYDRLRTLAARMIEHRG